MDDPRDVFLSESEVMSRYGWGKTKGYQNLKDRELVPPPVMTHPNRRRLDHMQRVAVTNPQPPTITHRAPSGDDVKPSGRCRGLAPPEP